MSTRGFVAIVPCFEPDHEATLSAADPSHLMGYGCRLIIEALLTARTILIIS